MSMIDAAAVRDRIRDRVHDRRDRAGGAGFAHALHAERIGGRGHVVVRLGDRRHVVGARHRVVHERAGDELPVALVIDGVLHQRLPDALREPADQLALDERVIEHDAGIVHRRIGDDLDHAGVRIDLDLGDVAAVREGLRRVDRRLGVERVAVLPSRAPRPRTATTRRSVPTTSKCPLSIGDVGLGGFQHARRRSALPSPASGRRRDRARCRPSWSSASRPRGCPSGRDRCRHADARSARPECRASRRSGADRSWRGPGRCSARRCRARACRRRETAATRFRSAARRRARGSTRCRCRAACCA